MSRTWGARPQQALNVKMNFVKGEGKAQQFVRIPSLYHSPGTRDIKPNLTVEGMVHHRDLAWRWYAVRTTIKIRAHDFLLIAYVWGDLSSARAAACRAIVEQGLLWFSHCELTWSCGSPIAGPPGLLLRVAVNLHSQGCSQCKLPHWQCGNHIRETKE